MITTIKRKYTLLLLNLTLYLKLEELEF